MRAQKMEMVIKKPDILEIFSNEGISLQQRGRYLWACCPLHSEKTPSFCVNPEKQSFKYTIVYLGISSNGQAETNPPETRRRELIEKFKEWCCNYTKYLCERLRVCNQIDSLVKTSDDLELKGLSEMYLLRDVYQYHLSILNNREDETKFKLYEEVCYGNRKRKN